MIAERNFQIMIQFEDECPDLFSIPQQAVAELPATPSRGEIRPQPVAKLTPRLWYEWPSDSGVCL